MKFSALSQEQLTELEKTLSEDCRQFGNADLHLDLTRGKPAAAQLDLSASLDGILQGDFFAEDGTDTRNYGGILGIPEARKLGAELLEVKPEQVMAAGNSSLTLMYLFIDMMHNHGVAGPASSWRESTGGQAKFLCPVPGYDRHFSICEQFGIQMVTVPLTGQGPDMDMVEALVREDPNIKGIWCVPRYSNPTGESYSSEVIARLAALPAIAGADFRIMWDHAYVAHHLTAEPDRQASILGLARDLGTDHQILVTASTSKISHAGAGIAFAASSLETMTRFANFIGAITVGPDKVNQLRHVRLLQDAAGVHRHMERIRQLLQPKFDLVQQILGRELEGIDIATWSRPQGGYFISFDTLPGLAGKVTRLAADLGVRLTPAGSTFPYGDDPQDCNIRIAPSFPPLEELQQAMEVFTTCVKLVTVRSMLA